MTKYTLYLLAVGMLLAITKQTIFTPSQQTCRGLDKKVKVIVSKMRAGYTVKQGERYRAQLKQLKEYRYQCKLERFDVS